MNLCYSAPKCYNGKNFSKARIIKSIRTCISCRERKLQRELIRMQFKDGDLISFSKSGRSFYICKECMDTRPNSLQKALSRTCRKKINLEDLNARY